MISFWTRPKRLLKFLQVGGGCPDPTSIPDHPSLRAVFARDRDRVIMINSGTQFARSDANAVSS